MSGHRIKYAAACLGQGMSYAASARAAGLNETDLRRLCPQRPASTIAVDEIDEGVDAFGLCASLLPDASDKDCRKIAGLALAILSERVGPQKTQYAMVNIAAALPGVRVGAISTEAAETSERIPAREVLEFVADKYGLSYADLCSVSRPRNIARPRQIAMFAIKHICLHMSYPAIGRLIGGRDHTTVMHGVRKIEELIESDRETAQAVQSVIQHFLGRPDVLGGSAFADAIRFRFLCDRYTQAMKAAA